MRACSPKTKQVRVLQSFAILELFQRFAARIQVMTMIKARHVTEIFSLFRFEFHLPLVLLHSPNELK